MNERKELYLVLQKKWFLEILKGKKNEEYRDFTDDYIKRLAITDTKGDLIDVQKYDVVRFQMGYSKTQLIIECRGILVEADDESAVEFTTDNCNFVIELGEIIERINCESLNI